mmetsp:Transcript_14472/g.34268  ORF Transcript_14472/g.34268 Transcript_14472/m.34268 type:complete len:1552 (+) Transcript_14472:171-4826(+)
MSGGEAIPFVALKDGKFEVTDEAAAFLRTIDYPVSIIAVVGLYRTGKSFLMNRILLEQPGGFQVGPTVNPCTKGLWLWNKVLEGEDKDGNPNKFIIIDTEGIGALDTNSQHDSTIFSLALLLSSYFVYNSVGSIDEGALNNLSLVVNLTKHIHVRSSAQGGEDDGADFSQYFPTFLWLVRDFTLQLVTPDGQAFTAKEYLERALQPAPGFTEQIEAKNRIRRMLTHFFPDRDCFTMVRPVTDESLLQRLSETPSEKLRPEFREQMHLLRKTILSRAEPKRMNGVNLDGVALVNLAYAYTIAINTGAVPSIQNAWTYICENKCQQALNDAVKHYSAASKEMKEKDLPMAVDELEEVHREMEKEAWLLFNKHAIGQEAAGFKHQLEEKIRDLYRDLCAENAALGKERAKQTLEKLYQPIDMKLQEDGFDNFDEYETERKKVKAAYGDEVPNGPSKTEVLMAFMEQKLSETGSRFSAKTQLLLQKERAEAKSAIDEAQRELKNVQMEAEKSLGSVKLKLEYAEKYNEDAKAREKENKDEMTRMRSQHEEQVKEMRAKAEADLKSQVDALEERRSKAAEEASRMEQELMQFKKDQEMSVALLKQEKEFAQQKSEESQGREAELRKLLESAKRDSESEAKALQERFESERRELARTLDTKAEESEKTKELANEWQAKHAALGLQLSTQIKQLQGEVEAKEQERSELEQRVDNLEKVGGAKAKEENEQLQVEIETLRNKLDEIASEKTKISNQLSAGGEETQRLTSLVQQKTSELKTSEQQVKELTERLDAAERERTQLEDKARQQSEQLEELGKQLSSTTADKTTREQKLTAQLAAATEQLDVLKKDSESKMEELESSKAELEEQLRVGASAMNRMEEQVEQLRESLKEAEEKNAEGMSSSEAEWTKKLKEKDEKYQKKIAEVNDASERAQQEMKQGFATEKDVLEMRVKSLEGQLKDSQADWDEQSKEYEAAIDELERDLKEKFDAEIGEAKKNYADLEKKHYKMEADLTKTNEGLASRNEVIEAQLVEIKATYKQDRNDMETKYTTELKTLRSETEVRIKQLENDLSATQARNEMLEADMKKAEESNEIKIQDLTQKSTIQIEKLDAEKKDLSRLMEERHKEASTELEALRQEVKRHEKERLVADNDHSTTKALLERQISNLQKLLEEREAVVKDLEASKETELTDMKSKLQSMRSEDDAKLQKEREESKAKYEDLKTKSDEKIRSLKEELNAKLTEAKVLEERIDGFKQSEARMSATLNEYKSRVNEDKDYYTEQVKTLKENLKTVTKELQDEKSEHQMTQLRSQKQTEWDQRDLQQMRDELAEKKKLVESMISKEIYKRELDNLKSQHTTFVTELKREKEMELTSLDTEKKRLEEELAKAKHELKKALTDGVMTDSKQKELSKLMSEKERLSTDLEKIRADTDTMKKSLKGKEDELKKKEQEGSKLREELRLTTAEREELKKERDDLERETLRCKMEIKNIQDKEERKHQVEIMRLKTENEELKRADRKKQQNQIEPKGGEGAMGAAAPALSSALARVRARRQTAQGSQGGA